MIRFYDKLNIDDCRSDTRDLFEAAVGIAEDSPLHERMVRESTEAHNKVESRIDLRVSCTWLSKEEICLDDEWLKVSLNEERCAIAIRCPGFAQIPGDCVEGVWFYAVNAGAFDLQDENIMLQLYADMWGTAYAEAAVKCLEKRIKSSPLMAGKTLSDNFGPGYYGMELGEIRRFPQLLDFSQAGITVHESGIMEPPKTLTGLFLAIASNAGYQYRHIPASCKDCSGQLSKAGCRLCVLAQK